MKKEDLLIYNLGRSFLFASYFKFVPEKGYILSKSSYSRYPKYIEVDEVVKKLSKFYTTTQNSYIFTDRNNISSNLKVEVSKLDTTNWKKNLKSVSSELDIEKIDFVYFDFDRLIYTNGDSFEVFDIDLFALEFLGKSTSILKDIDLEVDNIFNYFSDTPPIPETIIDYQRSYLLGMLYAKFIVKKLDIKSSDHLIVASEYLDMGFLDKTGFVHGVTLETKIKNISFDSSAIWRLLVNEGLEEFEDFQYLNNRNFVHEFQVENVDIKKIRVVDNLDKTIKEIEVNPLVQNFISSSQEGINTSQFGNTKSNLLLNISKIDIKKIKDYNFFKYWFSYYRHKRKDYIDLKFSDKFSHDIIVDSDIDDDLQFFREKDLFYHDISEFNVLGHKNLLVTEGQMVEKGQVLLEKEFLGGTLMKRIRSKVDGSVELIDLTNKVITIKSNSESEMENKFDFKLIERISRRKSLIKVNGYRYDLSFMTRYEDFFGEVVQFTDDAVINRTSVVWMQDVAEISKLFSKLNSKDYPLAIVISSIIYNDFVKLVNTFPKQFSLINVVVINGFGDKSYSSRFIRRLALSSGKHIFLSNKEKSLYFLEKDSKFKMSEPPVSFISLSKDFSYDNWNSEGELIYNDKIIHFKNNDNSIKEVAEFNLINYNYE